jgi:hypothetical protein
MCNNKYYISPIMKMKLFHVCDIERYFDNIFIFIKKKINTARTVIYILGLFYHFYSSL